MNLEINGEARQFDAPLTLQQLLEQLDKAIPQVAVEVNTLLVPRSQHANHMLADGDQIEIVTLVGGG